MPVIKRPRLKRGGITLREVYKFSKEFYYPQKDDKEARMKLDISSAKMIQRQNFIYDRHAGEWKQTELRHLKFIFWLKSSPISYKKIDDINIHKYPVSVVIYDINLTWDSPFKWRTGTYKKVLFASKGSSKDQRKKIAEQNIRNGRQLDFFFKLEQILDYYGLLYGPNSTNKKFPNKANPSFIPYFDKHMLFVVEKFLRHLFTREGIERVKGALTKGRLLKQ